MACMVDFAVLVLESISYCSYTCIVPLFTPHCTSSGPSSDLLTKSIMDVIWQSAKIDSLSN